MSPDASPNSRFPQAAQPLHLVGIGASAGGLEALSLLLPELRAGGRAAYIVAQHMGREGQDELVLRLLQRQCVLPVVAASQGDTVAPDHVYLLRSGQDGLVRDGRIRLQPSAPGSLSSPSVSLLLRSLAEEAGPRAMAIVLSGTGSDGTTGARAIREQGGKVFAQNLGQAKFDGMPGNVLREGLVHEVASAQALGCMLAAQFARFSLPVPLPPSGGTAPAALERLLAAVQAATGLQFQNYKEETLLRRIEARMKAQGVATLETFVADAVGRPDELRWLSQRFLVPYSSFFRDRLAFAALGQPLLDHVRAKPRGEPIRIWVPGCASGEECYTLAILLHQALGDGLAGHPLDIMGSDLSAEALAGAWQAQYPPHNVREVEPAVLERYFKPLGERFEPIDAVRAPCHFTLEDVLSAAAPAPLDLVSCRNLLIYLKAQAQEHLIRRFHEALRPGGLLFIGLSENLGRAGNVLFAELDSANRLYRRR
jgi:chemotaxis methyl-accepting protein methylase